MSHLLLEILIFAKLETNTSGNNDHTLKPILTDIASTSWKNQSKKEKDKHKILNFIIMARIIGKKKKKKIRI